MKCPAEPSPPPPGILRIHAAVYVIWLILVSVQIFLVQTGDTAQVMAIHTM